MPESRIPLHGIPLREVSRAGEYICEKLYFRLEKRFRFDTYM